MDPQETRVTSLFGIPVIQVLIGILLFAALLHLERDVILITVLLLGLMTLARLWSKWGVSGVTARLSADKTRVFPGETFTLGIEAGNAKFLPVWLQVDVELNPALRPPDQETRLSKESGMLSYERVEFHWELGAERRGLYRIGPPGLRVADLLGFFPREKSQPDALNILVYPRLVPLKPFSIPRRDFFGRAGATSPVQDHAYLLGTRDYQQNQPARFIHWKASARQSRMQEKVFEHTEQEKVFILLDVAQFAQHEASGAFERAIEAAASLGVALDGKGYALGLATNGVLAGGGLDLVPVTRNAHHLPALLEVLARLQMTRRRDLVQTLKEGPPLPWGMSCVHFCYQEDEGTLATRRFFACRRVPMICVICKPFGSGETWEGAPGRTLHLEDIRVDGGERP